MPQKKYTELSGEEPQGRKLASYFRTLSVRAKATEEATGQERYDPSLDSDDDWNANVETFNGDKRFHLGNDLNRSGLSHSLTLVPMVGQGTRSVSQRRTPQLEQSPQLEALYPSLSPSQRRSAPGKVDVDDLATTAQIEELNALNAKFLRFKRVIDAPNVDLLELKRLSWNGIPWELRATAWQLLLTYFPANAARREATLDRKRREYAEGVALVLDHTRDTQTWHQIAIDVPRTSQHIKLYTYPATQAALQRILYLWAVRHPASGYVQGINDLCTPFFQTFLGVHAAHPEVLDPDTLPEGVLMAVEADTFWCLTKLLDTIQDNYIHEQPGILRQVKELEGLVARIDAPLALHLREQGVEFIQFSFRWMNCLLMRELNLEMVVRMWDTYLSETPIGFTSFHVYVCAAFLVKFSDELLAMDFQDIIMFLQNPPTRSWGVKDMELMMSEAFIWQSLYKHAGAHLR